MKPLWSCQNACEKGFRSQVKDKRGASWVIASMRLFLLNGKVLIDSSFISKLSGIHKTVASSSKIQIIRRSFND